ncbi:pentatricopeptide repeat-containing protein At5g47360 [Arachis stenosperma]|uniref:pentatricopeptide repeat-containing protein At5g47360 n=1 Tax=Arachis stenosperma TaxID=217475 RepID=UPI0025AD4332|nr:pentatricopeptide repeat-containing protein At5g47360 [Arachis stenosperma]XP_057751565.1 pentatricopeptide repeat-containing protein At5g47360 [Arachis stenosperma]XP_057751566.1 pentatricopeptide repeat-containing protein At5g47360 [Arachis stenosperma]
MPQFANSRFYACLLQHRLKALHFSTQQEGMASVSDTLYGHLKDKNYGSVERSLSKFKPKLDSRCVMEVMSRCYPQDPQLGLRFFIWAGFQSGYRHSAFMYRKACKLLGIDKNPNIVCDVIGSYENEGCFVNVNMFRVVFKLCKEAELCDVALWVFRKLGSFNMRADTVMYNVVISLCCKKGEIKMAGVLMREMSVNGLYPDSITYMAIIEGLCDAGQLDDAYSVLEVMRLDGCSPSSVVLSAVLDGFCRSGSMERALKLLDEMEKEGANCSPNVVTYTSVIQSFCKRGQHAEAFDILDRMKAHGCRANHVAVFIILESLCAEGHLEEAHRLIDKFVEEHDVSYGQCYSSFVVSLIKIRQLDEAEKLFRKMLAGKIKPDTFSCGLLLKELCMKGRLLNGFYLLDEIENTGYLYSIDIDIYFILLIGLCRSNHLIEAAKLARIMLKKSVPLRRPNAYSALNILSKYGEQDLVNQLLGMQKRFR